MNVSCPTCQAPVPPGAQFCSGCGSPLLREVTPGSTEPTCAVHPGLRGLAACSRCGSFACARCLRQAGTGEPLCATCHGREPAGLLPWDRREELGTLKAYWKTCVDIMLRPGPTFEGIQPGGSTGSSLYFAALCSLVGFFTTGLIYMAIFALIPLPPTEAEGGTASSPAMFRGIMAGTFGVWILLAPVLGVLATLLSSALDHVVLKVAGAGSTFDVTLRANALSQAPMLLGLIPLCSLYVAPFWAMGLRVVAYRSLHRTSWGKAVFAALTVPGLTCFLCGGAYVALIIFALSAEGLTSK